MMPVKCETNMEIWLKILQIFAIIDTRYILERIKQHNDIIRYKNDVSGNADDYDDNDDDDDVDDNCKVF